MNINEKLEEMRKKPEHIRLRYVWAMVAISMFFVIIIWFFSIKSSRIEIFPATNIIDTSKITDQLNVGKQSLENATEEFKSTFEQQQLNDNTQNNNSENTEAGLNNTQ